MATQTQPHQYYAYELHTYVDSCKTESIVGGCDLDEVWGTIIAFWPCMPFCLYQRKQSSYCTLKVC